MSAPDPGSAPASPQEPDTGSASPVTALHPDAAPHPEAAVPAGTSPAPRAARRRLGWADVACVGGLALSTAWYLVLIPAIPALLGTHPVLLEALSGSVPAMVAAGAFARVGRASLVLAIIAPVAGLSVFDPLWWWAGRRYGERVTRALGRQDSRAGRSVRRGLDLFRRRGGWALVLAYYLPAPNTVLYAAAGWTGFGFLRFALLDLAGTLLHILLGVGLGYALGARAAVAAGLISRYALATTVALIAVMLLAGWWRNRPTRAAR